MKYLRSKFHQGLALLVFISILLPGSSARAAGVWGTRPLLSYFALTASLELAMRSEAGLSPVDFRSIEEAAQIEAADLQALYDYSEGLIGKPEMTPEQKVRVITAMGYNDRVSEIIYRSDARLRQRLPEPVYLRLVNWIERRWPVEVGRHGLAVSAPLAGSQAAARSYEIFATRYESKGGAYTAALPDQCLKLSNGGLKTCSDKGYQPGAGYSVALSYKKGVGVVVGESGPWNIDDNYWATLTDPTPRRMFADLPLGIPEAQAAYFNGYNGGVDQYGRTVTAPFGIDLAFKVADDIGLPEKKNDWITVSYLWTADWGAGAAQPAAPAQDTGTPAPDGGTPIPEIPLIETVEPGPDGSIVHTVRAGETLWTVAVAYQVPVAQIQFLNNLGATIVIYEGQKLVIKEAGPTWTPKPGTGEPEQIQTSPGAGTLQPERTATIRPQSQVSPTATSTRQATLQVTDAATGSPTETPAEQPERGNPIVLSERSLLIGALALAVGGALLFGIGWLVSRLGQKQDDSE